jgi:methionyl-tRNA formyltransferase
MRVIFMGTPDFAVPCLKILVENKYDVCAVFTQPDKPKGRRAVLTPPPVKVCAEDLGIPVFQPAKLKDPEVFETIRQFAPDVIAVTAYGKILPQSILSYPKYGCINIHASLLPSYRGAAPVQWAILSGEDVTGVTAMFMDAGLDTGDMLDRCEIPILEDDDSATLSKKLSQRGAELLVQTLCSLENNTAVRTKQGESDTPYASMLDKTMSPCDFARPSRAVHDHIRGLYPWPCATVSDGHQTIKILRSSMTDKKYDAVPGTVVTDKNKLYAVCDNKELIEITTLQLPGKNPVSASDYLRGHKPPEKFS